MNRKAMVKGLGLVFATVASFGLANQASADVYSLAKVEVTNLFVAFGGFDESSAGPGDYQFSSQAGATLNNQASTGNSFVTCNGNFAAGTGNCGDGQGGIPVLSGDVANAPNGDSDRAEDTFNVFAEAGGEYSNAESTIFTSTLSSGGLDLTAVSGISESNLVTGTEAAAATTTQSTTSIQVDFTIDEDDASTLTIGFVAAWMSEARITDPDDGQTQTTISFLSSVTGTEGAAAGYFAIWNPGSVLACTGDNCSAIEAGDLNETLSTDTVGAPQANNGGGFFQVTLTNLASGTYSVALTLGTSTLIQRNEVPVPGTLLLMGVGLLAGAGMSRRKKA